MGLRPPGVGDECAHQRRAEFSMRSDNEKLVSYSTFCLTVWACRRCYMLARCSASFTSPLLKYLSTNRSDAHPSIHISRDHPRWSPTLLTK